MYRYVSYILNVDYIFMNVADTNIEFYETKRHKWIQDILNDVIGIVDTRPKNRFIVNRKSPYKEYIYNQYEGK